MTALSRLGIALGMLTLLAFLVSFSVASEPVKNKNQTKPNANKPTQHAKPARKPTQHGPMPYRLLPHQKSHNNQERAHTQPAHPVIHPARPGHYAKHVVVEIGNQTSVPVLVSISGGQSQMLAANSSIIANGTLESGVVHVKAEWGRAGAKRVVSRSLKVTSDILHATVVYERPGTSVSGIGLVGQ